MTLIDSIEQQARFLADENRKTEPGIGRIYWFPNDHEIRIVALFGDMPISAEGILYPFYFRPSPMDGLTAPSSVTLIRPEEFGKLTLPEGWGDWKDAIEI